MNTIPFVSTEIPISFSVSHSLVSLLSFFFVLLLLSRYDDASQPIHVPIYARREQLHEGDDDHEGEKRKRKRRQRRRREGERKNDENVEGDEDIHEREWNRVWRDDGVEERNGESDTRDA